MTTSVTCYTDRVMTRFLQAKKRQAQACGARRGRIEPWRRGPAASNQGQKPA